ncbi:hypothetical protein BT96DRAFT_121690 [Gymnopus androsaceus JB14]|uniref:Uncharacterized protein n=1 Tax=Gymnopus androsaceus JB14 TaxID=1447944 RepID=A0A6A4GBW8_9AGAR|nr:hypothetical protein BT96DRAFT_121690 [Gymnopus androsaceus JB14]
MIITEIKSTRWSLTGVSTSFSKPPSFHYYLFGSGSRALFITTVFFQVLLP